MNKQMAGLRTGRRLGAAAAAMVVATALSACGDASSKADRGAPKTAAWVTTTPAAKGPVDTVKWNFLLEPTTLDPAGGNNYGASESTANLCESLQKIAPDYSVHDGLATLKADAGRTRLVYTIDDRARFWDGKPVTGEDAAWSLKHAWQPPAPVQPIWTAYFSSVKSIAATGPREVTVTLNRPDRLFETMMATAAGAVVEKDFAVRQGKRFGTPKGGIMCSGPYKLASWKSGSGLRMTRNDAYRGAAPKVKNIDFSWLQGDAATATAIAGGAVDGMYQPPATALDQLKRKGTVYYGKTLLWMTLIPTQKAGPLQDARIRKALFLAVDRKATAEKAFFGAAAPSRTVVPADAYVGVKATKSAGTGGSPEELAEAKKLVQEAGSPKGRILLVAQGGFVRALDVTMQALADAGRKIGLNTQYKAITAGQYYGLFGGGDAWKAVNADGFGSQWNLPVADPLSQYVNWMPKSFSNYGGFDDAAATALIDKASGEADTATRNATLAQADERLFGQMPWIPVVEAANTLYMSNKLTGPPASFVEWWYPWAADLGAR